MPNLFWFMPVPILVLVTMYGLIRAVARNANYMPFLLTLVPPAGSSRRDRPRDVLFVLDRSGSMSGWKMAAARRAVARMVDTLTDRDRFTVYALNDFVCPDNGDQANTPDCDVPSSQEALPQIAADAIAKGALVGTYSR